MIRLGLTGSIGMGKSTTAAMFAGAGVPVWDADAAVHRLYAPGGEAVEPMRAAFPAAVTDHVSRPALKALLAADPTQLVRIEGIVHPLVAEDRERFQPQADLVVFDIPLLFERDIAMDVTLLVTAPHALQRTRVLARPGMTEDTFDLILSRQMPDRDKRARADHVIETLEMDATRLQVQALIRYLCSHA
ncbi:dephospho-CoA kinase [Falsirhodobacter sp. 20TX0035]|uniref:dephospho-CoA kinase n=1 Tax=Falsirhodobacter sp. 20TX0035 TaxID=3022019 RepID=UPI00232C9241|nr:dephospho-CoA kinase [Falsirhodobacter sp. 20TX0035]MDB6452764.1 dephospho-CoA kinase [Falsirhodobacter sp. 20TX0035]